jgi:tetratricopeptide (TPR) repeat protein
MDLYQRGVMYGNRNLLLEAMELVPDSALFPYHLQAGRDQVKSLLEELESDPSNLDILLNLGHAFYQAGDYKKSEEFLKMVLEKEPQQSFANLYMGHNLMELGQGKEAKLYFEKAVKRDPRQLRTVMQEIALIGLLEQLEKEGSDVGLINAAAQFYNVKNKYRKSLEYSHQALEKDPMNQQAMRNAFFSYRGLGQPDDLIDMGERYEMIGPEDLPFQYIMAEIFIKTLRCDRAIPYLKKVLAKDDTYQDTQKLLNHCERKKTQDASNS